MPIVIYSGKNVKEYEGISEKIITDLISGGSIKCEQCLRAMRRHSQYDRVIKETGERIRITVVWCSECREWHALLPDFLLPYKHYSGNEIEAVIIDSESSPVSEIDTEANESTVRRWVRQIGERVRQAVSRLKYIFRRDGRSVSEVAIDPGSAYSELAQLLEMAPSEVKSSGNKLGLANLWLSTNDIREYI